MELKIPYTYRIQLLPHQHFKVVLFMQQLKYVCHLIVPSNASEETHLKREKATFISIIWNSLSQTTAFIKVACRCQAPGIEGFNGQAALLSSLSLVPNQGPLLGIQKC